MILVSLATFLLFSNFSFGQQSYMQLNISGTKNPFDVSFNATLNLTCGPDAEMSEINVKTCPPENCYHSTMICPFRNKTAIENNCLHQQNCFHIIFWSCPSTTPSEVTLEITYTCSMVRNDFTATTSNNPSQRPLPRPSINKESSATSTSTGYSTRTTTPYPLEPENEGYSTRSTTLYPLESENEDKNDTLIIILCVVLVVSVIAFLTVIVCMCCIRRRCHKHRQDDERPGIALSRPSSVLNTYATSPLGRSKSFSKVDDVKVNDESEIYSEIDLDDDVLDGSAKGVTANPKTDIDSGYNELYSEIDLPVTVIHVQQNPEIAVAPKEVTKATRTDPYDHISLDNAFEIAKDPKGTTDSIVGEMQTSGNPDIDDDKIVVDYSPDSKIVCDDSKNSELCQTHDDFTKHSADKTGSCHPSNSKCVDEEPANRTDVTGPKQHGYFTLECIDEVENHKDDMSDTGALVVSICSLDEDEPRCDVVLPVQSMSAGNGKHLKTKDLKSIEDASEYNTLHLSGNRVELKLCEGDIGTTASEYNTLSLSEPNSDVKKQISIQRDTVRDDIIKVEPNCDDTNERTFSTSDTNETVDGQFNNLKLCDTLSGINEVNQPIRSVPEKTCSSNDRIKDDSEYNKLNSGIGDVSFRNPKRSLPKDQVSYTDGRGVSENKKLNQYETVSETVEVDNFSQPNRSLLKEKFSFSCEREEASEYNKLNLCEAVLGTEELDGFRHPQIKASFPEEREEDSEYNTLSHLETVSGIEDITVRRKPPKKKVSFTDETEHSEKNQLNHYETVKGTVEVVNFSHPREKDPLHNKEEERGSDYNTFNKFETVTQT